jgi:(p)ppGpp synthase/HD superfamily hydrolase
MQADLYNEPKIEYAMLFLFQSMSSCRNSKPVALHSIRVASILWGFQTEETIVIAALLHDLVEDTDVAIEQIEKKFGKDVAAIVDACTFDDGNDNYSEKIKLAKQSIDQAVTSGLGAVLVKAADFIDNSNYYSKVDNQDLKNYLSEKYTYFMNQSEQVLKDTRVWTELVRSYNSNVKHLI